MRKLLAILILLVLVLFTFAMVACNVDNDDITNNGGNSI